MQGARIWRPLLLAALLTVAGASAGAARLAASTVGTQELRVLLAESGDGIFLLDVRTPGEFRSGRIPGSVLVPMQEVPSRLADIPRDKVIVVVCASGARSAAVARYLRDQGYPSVANCADGVVGWQRRGLPVER